MKPVTREADIIGRTYAITATASIAQSSIRVETGRHVVIGELPATVADAMAATLDLDPIAARLLLTAIRTTVDAAHRRAVSRMVAA